MGKVLIGNIKGPQGPTGVRGGMWLQGTAVTGTSTEETSFPDSGITYAIIGDAYFNTETCDVYACTKAGNPTDAKWVYTGNIKGVKGDTGSTQSIQNAVLEFNEALTRENIESTDTVETIFGKVKKYFSDLGTSAFMNVVNSVTQSEAGQAVLDAAVGKYLEEKKFDISKIIANRNITEPGFVMDGKTVADALTELNGNIKKQDICKAVAELSSSGWYRIATKTSGDTDINAFGGYGESGIIIISRIFSYGNNESYVILFNSSYNKHVVFRCVGASVNLQLIDKLRISLTSAQSLNIELHYNSSNINQVSVTAIYNQCDKKWSSVNLTQVTETVSDVAVYNIPTEDDVTKLTYDIVYPISVEVPERSNLATVPFRTE